MVRNQPGSATISHTNGLTASFLRCFKYQPNDSPVSRLLDGYRDRTQVSLKTMVKVKHAILDQMQRGLSGKRGGLLMLPSFVDAFPSSLVVSDREACYFAIDLGGTGLKIVRIQVRGGKLTDVEKREWAIPDECYETDNGRLMAWIVECFSGFTGFKRPVIGFCYSFACRQDNLDHGEQILWTKRFTGTGLLGTDVVQTLREEFSKQGIEAVIPVLMNDSVASLVGAQFADPRVQASVILGTGTNCSLVEDVRNIKTLPEVYRKHGDRMIINTEWGDCALPKRLRITLEEDEALDRASANPGHGLFEKLVSGLYIGDVSQRILGRIAAETGILKGILSTEGSFDGAAVSVVYHDTSDDLHEIATLLGESFGMRETTQEERKVVRDVCVMITRRSARLCAAAIAAVASREASQLPDGDGRVVISVDGSTFTKFAGYRALVEAALDELRHASGSATGLPRIELTLADGSSGSGAAVCAAVFTNIHAAHDVSNVC